MALIKRMKEGDKSPTLYSWYDKQYDFDQFKKEADEGVQEYISSLKRGSKDIDQFMRAYSDIMEGIKDGSITFKDGKYVDARGRYSNGLYYDDKDVKQTSKRSSKDYYGLMANYIYGKQRSQNEYTAPEDKTKIKWAGSSSIGKAITRNIFNSDTWNNQDFQDLNEYDESGKVKGTDNRHKKLYDAFDYVLGNFDNLFSGYSDQDKENASKYISEAMNKLKDGKINPGDYLALNKAASGLDYRSMFSDRTVETPALREEAVQVPETDFVSWVSKKYPIFSGTLHTSRSLNDGRTYGPDTLNRITQAVNSLSESDLYRIIRSALADKNYVFNNEQSVINTFGDADYQFSNPFGVRLALQALRDRGLLKSFGDQQLDLYYIPNTDNNKRFTSWVWDAKNGTLSEMSYHDIPYWREKILAEWQGLKGTPSGDNTYWTSRYGSFKEGGILKAQYGGDVPDILPKKAKAEDWYSRLFDFDLSNYTYQYDTNELVNADILSKDRKPWISDTSGNIPGNYKPTKEPSAGYTKGIEDSEYYKKFGESLLNQDGTFTDIGKAWALATDKLLPSNSPATFFNEKGDLRKSWTIGNTTYNSLAEYLNHVRNDQKLGARHNVFLNTGTRYFYKDKEGNIHWVDPEQAKNYNISEKSTDTLKDGILWKDYELTGTKNNTDVKKPTEETSITPKENTIKTKKPGVLDFVAGITPSLIGAGRLLSSLRTNNKVAETIRKSLNPVLKDTYELYSPITGAFSEMQLRNNQAADVRRQTSRPFTSDASLQLAGMLEANRRATDLERQGFLADDAEIKRTKAEALKRQEDNAARRSEVANFNRASINQINRELAQLKAAKLKQNWQSLDNFLSGLESRTRQRIEESLNNKRNFRLQTTIDDINNQYYDAIQEASKGIRKWQSKNPDQDITTAGKTYEDYIKKVRELQKWKDAQKYGAHANVYGYSYSNPYLSKNIYEILGRSFKNGGTLKPSVQYLIRKVIRNENNT